MDASVSNNFDAAVCQQQIHQDTIVTFRIPDAQLREDFDGTLTRYATISTCWLASRK